MRRIGLALALVALALPVLTSCSTTDVSTPEPSTVRPTVTSPGPVVSLEPAASATISPAVSQPSPSHAVASAAPQSSTVAWQGLTPGNDSPAAAVKMFLVGLMTKDAPLGCKAVVPELKQACETKLAQLGEQVAAGAAQRVDEANPTLTTTMTNASQAEVTVPLPGAEPELMHAVLVNGSWYVQE